MKKIVLSVLVILGIVLLTGCGKIDFNKTSRLVCSKTDANVSDNTTTIMTLAYDENEKINSFRVEENVQYNTKMSPKALELTEKAMKLIGSIPGIDFESKVGDNSLYFSFTGDIKMMKTLMKQLNKNYSDDKVVGDTKQEAITELTNDGYTCEDVKK